MGRFRRRRFLGALGATTLVNPLVSTLQAKASVPRVGVLTADAPDAATVPTVRKQLQAAFARAGYEVGKNLILDWRFGSGMRERLEKLASELVGLNVDVIMTWGVQATHAAARAIKTTPIVMISYYDDPVERGLVTSLARPGGNVTGMTWVVDLVDLSLKQFELLKRAAPSAVRIAALWWPWSPNAQQWVADLYARIEKEIGFVVTGFVVHGPDEVPSALNRIAAFKPDALHIASFPIYRARLPEIAAFAIREKLISFATEPIAVDNGLLLYYGPSRDHIGDRAVAYVDRILHGAKPSELPVEQPAEYALWFNAKTAQSIEYKLPPELQLRLEQVIE